MTCRYSTKTNLKSFSVESRHAANQLAQAGDLITAWCHTYDCHSCWACETFQTKRKSWRSWWSGSHIRPMSTHGHKPGSKQHSFLRLSAHSDHSERSFHVGHLSSEWSRLLQSLCWCMREWSGPFDLCCWHTPSWLPDHRLLCLLSSMSKL